MTTADRVLMLLVAVACAFALGAAGTSLDSAVATSPDDVIDIDQTGLPISENAAREVREQVENKQREPDREQVQRQRERQQQPQNAQQPVGADPSLLDWLLALLRQLLPLALAALIVGLLVVTAYRQRHRLIALLSVFASDEPDEPLRLRPRRPLDFAPENEVDAAWVRLVAALGDRAGDARTTSEYARIALEAGLDADGVAAVTRAFEEVRYGGLPVDDDRRTRATDGLKRLNLEGGSL